MAITCRILGEGQTYAVPMKSENDELMDEIDNETILVAYKILKEAAEKLGLLSNNIHSAVEYCSANDLSISGKTYEGTVEDCSTYFQFASKNIDEYAELLRELVQKNIPAPEEEHNINRREQEREQRYEIGPDGIKTYFADDPVTYNITLPTGSADQQ